LSFEVVNCAVTSSAHEGESADFYVGQDFWASSLVKKPNANSKITVPAQPFNTILCDRQPNVIFMDVEGAEVELLEGANLEHIDKLCVELHPKFVDMKAISRLIGSVLDQGLCLDIEKSIGDVLVFLRN
ncbi:MAG TPA: FkbM family methyltransferase, partial [Verrucomicrobiae bacterium]|nr:FkbM family methyltransferase [Verrucomicrobiae bacterium]